MSDYEETEAEILAAIIEPVAGGAATTTVVDQADLPANKRKRNRKPVTCAQCRKRKLKCDRLLPCGSCREKNQECIWDDAVRLPQHNYTRDQEAVDLRAQLDRLEGLIEMLGGQDDVHQQQSQDNNPNGRNGGMIAGPSGIRAHEFELERNSAAEALGLLAGNLSGSDTLSQPNLLTPGNPVHSTIDLVLGILPPKNELDMLINQFLSDDMSEFPIIFRPSFQQRYLNFSRVNAHNDPFFVALLLAISGWTIHWNTVVIDEATSSFKNGRARTYFAAAMQMLHLAGYMDNPSLDCVRTLFMLYHYNMLHNSPSARHLLTSAIQVAQSLGLNRDPISYTLSVLEREERRRIWTLLISTDWIFSPDQSYVCSATHYNTAVPLNLNDQDISEESIIPRALTVSTPVLGLLFKSSIASISIRITDICYGFISPPSFMNIQSLNSELAQLDTLIPAFEWHNGGVKALAEVTDSADMIRVHAHLQLRQQFIRLNRPFLTRGFSDPRLGLGREKCCWAARYVLAIHRGLGLDFRATKDWSITLHALNSIIILVIDLLQDSEGTFSEMHYNDVGLSMQIIDSLSFSDRTPVVIETSRVIKILLNKIGAIKSSGEGGPSKKRKLDNIVAAGKIDTQASTSLASSDLAYLLSTTQNPSSAFRPRTAEETQAISHQRFFDPSIPFNKSLPLPSSIDPIPKKLNLLDSTSFSLEENEYRNLWKGLNGFKSMYAVPDHIEWEELSKNDGSAAWSEGIDLLN